MTVADHLKRALQLVRNHPKGALAHVNRAHDLLRTRKAQPAPAPKPPSPHPLTIFGVDYAWGNKPYSSLKAAGVKFAMRYISHDLTKDLLAGELIELHKHGIKVGLVFESGGKRALGGYLAGVQDAGYAKNRTQSLGLGSIPVFFAVDWDATDAQKPAIASYLRGAATILGKHRVGVYGSYHVVRYAAHEGVCDWFWQTYAWSGGLIHGAVHLLQYRNAQSINGLSVDFNKARTLDFTR